MSYQDIFKLKIKHLRLMQCNICILLYVHLSLNEQIDSHLLCTFFPAVSDELLQASASQTPYSFLVSSYF